MELPTLPDYLREGLDIVFVGLNPSLYSVREAHYFANPRNRFWTALNRSGLLPVELCAYEDHTMMDHGVGLTDLVKRPTSQAFQLKASDYREWAPRLRGKLERYQPLIACFHGTTAYGRYLKHAEGVDARTKPGRQERLIGGSAVFVTPNPSPANARYSVDDLAGWYLRLRDLRDELRGR